MLRPFNDFYTPVFALSIVTLDHIPGSAQATALHSTQNSTAVLQLAPYSRVALSLFPPIVIIIVEHLDSLHLLGIQRFPWA